MNCSFLGDMELKNTWPADENDRARNRAAKAGTE